MSEMAAVRPREPGVPQLSMVRPRIVTEGTSGIDVPMPRGTGTVNTPMSFSWYLGYGLGGL